jgi:capsular exopolysaccharide synthesis family protein
MPLGDLRTYATILRRRKWSVIFVLLLTVGAAVFFSYRQTPMYRSTATVQVKPLNPNQLLQGYSYNFAVSMQTEEALATSPEVAVYAQEAAATLGVTTPDTGTVSADVPPDTTFLNVSYSAPDPAQAQGWAQAYALGYMKFRAEQARGLYTSALEGLRTEISRQQDVVLGLQGDLAAAPLAEKAEIRRQIAIEKATLENLASASANVPFPVTDTAAELIAPAALPSEPYAPDWVRNIALALFAGLALGLTIAFVRERLDDRMTGRADFEDVAGAPVLAVIPSIQGWRRKKSTRLVTVEAPKSPPAEAYRTIRTNIGFLSKTSGLKIITVTSPGIGEGKTTTTANLAVTLARSGKRVIAIGCDLRKPRLHTFFGLRNDRGLTNLLVDGLSVPDVARRVDGIDTLRVITSGPVPHNPAELLGSDEMEALIEELRRFADYVVFDTAPVLAVSDGPVLASKTDGVVLVADATSTHRSAIRAAREQLEQVGANIVGAVFNNFDPSKAKSYPGYYRYEYYGQQYQGEEPTATPRRREQPQVDPAEFWS